MPAQTEKSGRVILWALLLFAAVILGFALGGAYVYYYYPHGNETPTSQPVEANEVLRKVVALGRIEPKDGILSLGVAVPDRIREITVKEDDLVDERKLLVVLESQVTRKLDMEMAVIQLDQAKKRLTAIRENGEAQIRVEQLRRDRIEQLEPIEIKMLESKKKLLEKQKRNAQRNYERYVEAGDTIAGMDKEKQELVQRQIETEIEDTQNQIDKLRKSSTLDRSLAAAQLHAAEAELQQSQSSISLDVLDKQVQQAQERLNETEIRAPRKGKILRIFVHKGELVQAKPILQMANVDRMIVLTEVDETDIPRVRLGQSATVTSHVFGEKEKPLSGKVVWIAGSVGKAEMIPLDPRAAVSDRVVHVKVELDQPERVASLIGLQVHVEIHTDPSTAAAR